MQTLCTGQHWFSYQVCRPSPTGKKTGVDYCGFPLRIRRVNSFLFRVYVCVCFCTRVFSFVSFSVLILSRGTLG